MKKYVCDTCGWEYDPEVGDPDNGIEPGTAFEDLPEDFVCPVCGVGKDEFSEAQFYVQFTIYNVHFFDKLIKLRNLPFAIYFLAYG